MQTLVLVRHGKSDWSDPVPDEERPLAPRGRRQALLSGAWLAEHGPRIDLAVVSPARRARDTWALVATRLEAPPPAVLDERAYVFDAADLRAVLADPDLARHPCVALVGHDPGLTDLAGELAGHDVAMPTSAVVVLAVRADGTGSLLAAGRPPTGPMNGGRLT